MRREFTYPEIILITWFEQISNRASVMRLSEGSRLYDLNTEQLKNSTESSINIRGV